MQEFVLPGLRTLSRGGREVFARDLRPITKKVRPSTKCKYLETGLIYAQVSSILPKSHSSRELLLDICRTLGTADEPQLIYNLDSQDRVRALGNHYEGIEGADVLHSFLSNCVRQLRTQVRDPKARIIYPGRDVWAFEVLSQRMGVRSLYDSGVSRDIATNQAVIKKVVETWPIPNWHRAIAFDSGYAGTVPRAIGRAAGLDRVNIVMLSAEDVEEQVFPGHTGSRAKALALEYCAKYRKRAIVCDGEIHQPLAMFEEFVKAALLTIWLWHHVSPKRLPSWQARTAPREKKRKGLTINASGLGMWSQQNIVTVPSAGFGTALSIPTLTMPGTGIASASNIAFATSATGASNTGTINFVDTTTLGLFQSNTAATTITGGLI